MLSILKDKKKLNNNWKFEYFVVFIFAVFGILGWQFNYIISSVSVLILTFILLFIFNDNKYIIPGALILLFSYNEGFVVEEFPFDIVIPVALYAILVIVYIVKNFDKKAFKSIKSYKGLAIVAIFSIIPIFWCTRIDDTNRILYIMYFSYFLYLLLFFLVSFAINKDSFRIMIFSFSWLAFLISYECIVKPVMMYLEDPSLNILSIIFQLGWGVCNEGGLMLCFLMPFVFYIVIKSKNIYVSMFGNAKIILILAAILLTNSRGALIFGLLEYGILMILTIIFSKERLFNIAFMLFFVIFVLMAINIKYGIVQFFEDIYDNVFFNQLSSSGRSHMWEMAGWRFERTWYTRVFGSGIITDFDYMRSHRGDAMIFVVYHSTFYEMLVVGGIIGIIGLSIHFIEKYHQIINLDLSFTFTMLTGYAVLDLYGMIDNSYGMFYYMVPLMILMAVLDKTKNVELFINKYDLVHEI